MEKAARRLVVPVASLGPHPLELQGDPTIGPRDKDIFEGTSQHHHLSRAEHSSRANQSSGRSRITVAAVEVRVCFYALALVVRLGTAQLLSMLVPASAYIFSIRPSTQHDSYTANGR